MNTPRSFRFSEDQLVRLADYARKHGNSSISGAGIQLIEEGLRMHEHPGITFRDGPAGRRAVVSGGPDVWEVIQAVRDHREAEPGLPERELVEAISEHTGTPSRLIKIAIGYWSAYPDEINKWITRAVREANRQVEAWQRQRDLLAL